jgi:hypothetical protein
MPDPIDTTDHSIWVIDPVLEHDGWTAGIPSSISTTLGGVTSLGAGDVGRFIIRRALSRECPEVEDDSYNIAVM